MLSVVFRYSFILLCSGILLLASCGRNPFPCFTASEREDSIPINKEVYFNAVCSDKAQEYFWEFPGDSIAYDEFVSYIFRDTGVFDVTLLVGNGTKTRTLTKQLTVVNP